MLASLIAVSLNGMEVDESKRIAIKISGEVVPNSSYFVYEGDEGIIGGIPTSSKMVTFYGATGDAIETIEHHRCFPIIERKLDPQAPKPQPTSCALRYWPAIRIIGNATKGVPGDFIVFYDKNGNKIVSHRIKADGIMLELFDALQERLGDELDLSKIRQGTIVDMRLEDRAHDNSLRVAQGEASSCRLF